MRVAKQLVRCKTVGEVLKIVEPEGRLFSENGSGSCWIDMDTQTAGKVHQERLSGVVD